MGAKRVRQARSAGGHHRSGLFLFAAPRWQPDTVMARRITRQRRMKVTDEAEWNRIREWADQVVVLRVLPAGRAQYHGPANCQNAKPPPRHLQSRLRSGIVTYRRSAISTVH